MTIEYEHAPPESAASADTTDTPTTTVEGEVYSRPLTDTQRARIEGQRPAIAVRNLTKTYQMGQTRVQALRGVTAAIFAGEFVSVMGPSGSGKSTFMNLLGCLDRPTSGEYWLAGTPVGKMTPDALADIRNRRIGFVFQGFNLLARATALENVMLPLTYAGMPQAQQERRAKRALELVGLAGRAGHRPSQLSGGQQQRVAIARALVNGPSLLLADEPTGNLDSRTSLEIMAVLQTLNQHGLTIVLVTHEPDIAAYTRRQLSFRDGRLLSDVQVPTPRAAVADLLERRERDKQEAAALGRAPANSRPIQIREEPR
jgi:putative ABC transport system ATP-binding protein